MTALFSAVILFSCNTGQHNTQVNATNIKAGNDTVVAAASSSAKPTFDTNIVIDHHPFQIQFWQNTSGDFSDDVNNTLLLIKRDGKLIISDSLPLCPRGIPFHLTDLNHDGNLDLTFYEDSGGRGANELWNWFIYNIQTQSFNRIVDVDQYPTMQMDSSGLVISHAFYGEHVNESYFYINKNFELIDLKIEAETLEFDDTTDLSEKTFNKALQKYHQQKDK